MRLLRNLLWVDSLAGLVVGVLVLALSGWLSALYEIPRALVVTTGVANLLYGTYSGTLARRRRRPRRLLLGLIGANAAWAVVCAVLALRLASTASAFGLAHLIGEGVFVGGLALLEWRQRERLAVAP